MDATQDPRIDRLYELLPVIQRMRDASRGYPLQALLRVIAEQVNIVEDDIARLYDNWFIETAEDWAVPYLGDLIGYRPVAEAGSTADLPALQARTLDRILIPRREVAKTIGYRRRKGTLALLELLADDIAGWPARAVEFFRLLGWAQNLDHQHPERARLQDVRDVEALDRIGGAFDRSAHTVDVRGIVSHRTRGCFDIPSVGVFVWRLKPYSVTDAPAYCAENAGPHCYTFSVLGQDAPLFVQPEAEPDPTRIAGELNVPGALRRLAFARHLKLFYGEARSLVIAAEGWPEADSPALVSADQILPADLSDWRYVPPLGHVAVDPVLGRFAFPPGQLPRKGVRVTYHYAFSDDTGAGEYARVLRDPSPRSGADPFTLYRVGRAETLHRIGDALELWRQDKPADAVIELTDSGVYVEPLHIELEEEQTLQLRAASGKRPTIRLLDWQTDLPDALSVRMARGSRLTLDGLLITGRTVRITGVQPEDGPEDAAPACHSDVVIRHCTLVPGWGIDCDCEPKRPAEPSLELYGVRARLLVERSILGSIQIHEDEVTSDPIPVSISDSILDATGPAREALGSPKPGVAHAVLTIRRTTVFGIIEVHAIEIAEDSIFMGCLNVARRQVGCMRFCHVPAGCRTPRRYRCQPDMVIDEAKRTLVDPVQRAAEIARQTSRVRPQFTAIRYGLPAYAQLASTCADEIRRGASDESEMGAFHDLFQPQREASLAARLAEFTPAGMQAGILFVT